MTTSEAMKLMDAVQGSQVAIVWHEAIRTMRCRTPRSDNVIEQPSGTGYQEQLIRAEDTDEE
jgi:hypothetical protein